tara:strand:+ start:1152 stop:1574 length:423 start_codon:yes stop_codon:yes gene_type:complete
MLLGCDSSSSTTPETAEPGIPPLTDQIKEQIVSFARAGGEFIEERGGQLFDVAEKAWRKFFPKVEDGVKVDPEDELRGTLEGKYIARLVEINSDGKKTTIEREFTNPKMIRDSVDGPWRPDPELYAADFEEQKDSDKNAD